MNTRLLIGRRFWSAVRSRLYWNSVDPKRASLATYVFFPYLEVGVSGITDLTDAQQRYWVDDILRPALIATYGYYIRLHWPRSFHNADYRARVKGESGAQRTGQAMDIQYTISASHLDRVWAAVLRQSEEYA